MRISSDGVKTRFHHYQVLTDKYYTPHVCIVYPVYTKYDMRPHAK